VIGILVGISVGDFEFIDVVNEVGDKVFFWFAGLSVKGEMSNDGTTDGLVVGKQVGISDGVILSV
jgi:hypothetical protein